MTLANKLKDNYFPVRLNFINQKPITTFTQLDPSIFDQHNFATATQKLAPKNYIHKTQMVNLDNLDTTPSPLPIGGFIFHLSRCGSTLISQLLNQIPSNLVLSEPLPFHELTIHNLFYPSEPQVFEKRIHTLMNSYTQPFQESHKKRLIIKFTAQDLFTIEQVLNSYPTVPWVFVYRSPLEIMASLSVPPIKNQYTYYYYKNKAFTSQLLQESPEQVAQYSYEEIISKLLAFWTEKAIKHLPNRGLAINYSDLPQAAFDQLLTHFNIQPTAQELAAMQERANFQSKKSGVFVNDQEAKQKRATEEMRIAANKWAVPALHKLDARIIA